MSPTVIGACTSTYDGWCSSWGRGGHHLRPGWCALWCSTSLWRYCLGCFTDKWSLFSTWMTYSLLVRTDY